MRHVAAIRGRSFGELVFRSGQTASTWLERIGVDSDARALSTVDLWRRLHPPFRVSGADLRRHFAERSSPRFFSGFADPAGTVAAIRREFPESARAVLARADRSRRDRFDVLGQEGVSYSDPVDWHLDPLSGKRAPLSHWSQVNYLDAEQVGDHKVVWEVNRHQHFIALGQAYWLTANEAYAQTFVRHLTSWNEANPPKLGINWASSLEVSLRAVSWLWALHFFKRSAELTPDVLQRLLSILYVHARHLEKHLSTYFSPNTHLTGEALGLFYLGLLLPEFRRAARWRTTGWRILQAELSRQIRPDGVYFEQTTWYQRYSAEFYLHALALAEANGWPVAPQVRRVAESMCEPLKHFTRPDGRTPLIGDDDGGRLAKLSCAPSNDFRGTLATAAVIFGRADFAEVAGGQADELVWMQGAAALRDVPALTEARPKCTSRAFAAGGYFVMRDGWESDANYMLLDCGPHGALTGAHAHADALAFELTAHGAALLIDPGTFTYVGPERDHFRAATAHNTLTVDGESSSVPAAPFRWQHVAVASSRAWVATDDFDYFEGEHDGYRRLAAPAIHIRQVLFLKRRYWIVRDRVVSQGSHTVEVLFHGAPGTTMRYTGTGVVLDAPTGAAGLAIASMADGGAFALAGGWTSPSYGVRERAPVCTFSTLGEGLQEIVTALVPYRGQSPQPRVDELEADGGRAFSIATDGCDDLLLCGQGALVRAGDAEADGEWAWIRRRAGDSTPTEFLLIRGSAVRVAGQELFSTAQRAGWAAGRRCRAGWRVASGSIGPAMEG